MPNTLTNATGERIAGPDRAPAGVAQQLWNQLPDWIKFRVGADAAPPLPELLDVASVATLLGCSERHVYRLADCGKMPRPIKLGALVRWPRKTLMDWIEGGCQAVRPAGKGTR